LNSFMDEGAHKDDVQEGRGEGACMLQCSPKKALLINAYFPFRSLGGFSHVCAT
jgi:hypothetical protein